MESESDFLNWEKSFKNKIRDDDNYTQYFKQFIDLVTEIVDKNSFPEPIKDLKEHFLTKTFEDIMKQIVSMDEVDDFDKDSVSDFLQRLSFLVIKGFVKNISNFEKFVSLIFKSNNKIYSTLELKDLIIQFCYSQGAFKLLKEHVSAAGDELPNKGTYTFILGVFFNYFYKSNDNEEEKESAKEILLDTFDAYTRSIDAKSLRNVDDQEFLDLLPKFNKCRTKKYYAAVLNYAKLCLESEISTKNKQGIIVLFKIKIGCTEKEFVNKWLIENHLIDYILSHSFCDAVAGFIVQKMKFITIGCKIPIETINKLWKRIVADNFQKEQLSRLLLACIKLMKYQFDVIETFVNDTESDLETKKILLMNGISYGDYLAPDCLFTYLSMLKDEELDSKIASITKDMGEEKKSEIFVLAYSKLTAKVSIRDSLHLIKELNIFSESEPVDDTFLDTIISFTGDEHEKSVAFSIIKLYIVKAKKTLTSENIETMIANDRELAFDCLSKIIVSDSFKNFTEESRDTIIEKLKQLNPKEYTETSVYLLYVFILANGSNSNVIVVDKCITSIVRVTSNDVPYVELMLNVFMNTEDETIVSTAMNYLVLLASKTTLVASKRVAKILSVYIPYITGANKTQKIRALQFIREVILKTESTFSLEDFKTRRHNEKKDPKAFPVTVTANKREKTTILVTPTTKIENLTSRLSIIYEVNETKIKLTKGKSKLFSKRSIASENINSNTQLNAEFVKNSTTTCKKQYSSTLSYNFEKSELPTILLDMIRNETEDEALLKEATKTLNILPTDTKINEQIMTNLSGVLESATKGRFQKYIFIAISNLMEQKQLTLTQENKPIFTELWNNFKDDNIEEKNKPAALKIFTYIPEVIYELNDILFVISNLAFEGKCKPIFDKLFTLVFQCNKSENVRIITEEAETFIGNMILYDKETLENIKSTFDTTSEKGELCNSISPILGFIDEIRAPEYILPIIASVYTPESDTEMIIQFCKEHINVSQYTNGIAQIISLIFTYHEELISENKELIEAVYPLFINNCEQNKKSDALKIISVAIKADKELHKLIVEKLQNVFTIDFDSWNYDVSRDEKTLEGHTGLKNLCCTCYMNSVLQQLFANKKYRNQIISSNSEKPWIVALKKIFLEMLLTLQPSVTTQEFCASFLFHEIDPIDVRSQMDAAEFLGTLVDQLNTAGISNNVFKAIEQKTFSGKDEAFTENMDEECIFVQVPMKGTFDDFMEKFSAKEVHENYHTEQIDKPITVEAVTKLKVAPETLILQLNRFNYDMIKGTRTKSNQYFEFPFDIDIQKMMNDNSSQKYSLKGVIIHSGAADWGHYYSYIKEGEEWVEFNDSNVSVITLEEFKEHAYGSESKQNDISSESAYILFYNKVGLEEAEEPELDPAFVRPIEEENKSLKRVHIAFSESMRSLMTNISNIPLLLEYVMNVLIHSSEDSEISASRMFTHVLDNLQTQESFDSTINFLIENSRKIAKAISSEMPTAMKTQFTSFIRGIIAKTNPIQSINLVLGLLKWIPEFTKDSWLQTAGIFNFATAFIDNGNEFFKVAEDNHLFDTLIHYAEEYIDKLPTERSLTSFDLSKVFNQLSYNVDLIDKTLIIDLIDNYMKIIFANKTTVASFAGFLLEVAFNKIISFKDLVKRVIDISKNSSDAKNNYFKYLYTQCNEAHISAVTNEFVNQMSNGKVSFALFLADNAFDKRMKSIFIDFPQQTICSFINDASKQVRGKVESAFYKCFNSFEKLSPDSFAEKLVFQQTEDSNYYSDSNPTKEDISNLTNYVEPIIVSLKEAIEIMKSQSHSTCMPTRFCPLIRVALFIATNTNNTTNIVNFVWDLVKASFNDSIDENCNILQALISLSTLEDEEKIVFAEQHFNELFKALFPLTFDSRYAKIATSMFYAFYKLMSPYLIINVDEFKRIMNEQPFITSYREVIPLSTEPQFTDFLCSLKGVTDQEAKKVMIEKLGDQFDNVKKYIPNATSRYAQTFDIEDNSFPLEDVEDVLDNMNKKDFFMYDKIDSIAKHKFTEIPAQIIARARDCQLISSNKEFILGAAPMFAKLCSVSKEFFDYYFDMILKPERLKNYWYYMAQLCRICLICKPEETYFERIIVSMIMRLTKLNIIIGFPKESKQDFIDFFSLVDAKSDQLTEFIVLITGACYDETEITEIIISIIKKYEQSERESIFKQYAEEFHKINEESYLDCAVRNIHDIIIAFPESKDKILDYLALDEDSFSSWSDKSLRYIDAFIR